MPLSIRTTAFVLGLAAALLTTACTEHFNDPLPREADRGYIHVSREGHFQNPGTPEQPVPTISFGLQRAIEQGRNGIKVAAGSYPHDQFRLTPGYDIIGGCDPLTWEPVPGSYSQVVLTRQVDGVGIRLITRISGLDLVHTPEGILSSYTPAALHLYDCGPALSFEDCRFTAADGGDGVDGVTDDYYSFVTDGDAGAPGACAEDLLAGGGDGGDGYYCHGAAGGSGGPVGMPGSAGGITYCSGIGGAGGAAGSPGIAGEDGHDGQDGAPGANGDLPQVLGHFTGSGFEPVPSENGREGDGGQGGGGGGGGGGSPNGSGNGGGGGGGGGQPGRIGRGGWGGVHSFAVICRNTTSSFKHCDLVAAAGGAGGNGSDGQPGKPGGVGGLGGNVCSEQVGAGGNGGRGGRGGDSGAGAGGNGGCSYGLYVTGRGQPAMEGCTINHGEPGQGGAGGLAGDGTTTAPDGMNGTGGEILDESTK